MRISILVASNRPGNLSALLDNLQATAADPRRLEVLVALDEGDLACRAVLNAASDRSFPVRCFPVPRTCGYFGLGPTYDRMAAAVMADSHFVQVLSDEIRYLTPGWDAIVRRHARMFPDEVFFLRISCNRDAAYPYLYKCFWAPENYGFYTRQWLDAVGTFAGSFWSTDSWQGGVHYYLQRRFGVNRGVPVPEIRITGEATGSGLGAGSRRLRERRIVAAYWRMTSPAAQRAFCRQAALLRLDMVSAAREGFDHAVMDSPSRRRLYLMDLSGGVPLATASYRIGVRQCLYERAHAVRETAGWLARRRLAQPRALFGRLRRLSSLAAGYAARRLPPGIRAMLRSRLAGVAGRRGGGRALPADATLARRGPPA